MPNTTVVEAFDFPFRWVRQNSDPTHYAVGTLRIEPTSRFAAEYAVALPDDALAPPVLPSFAEAAGKGVIAYALEHHVVGVRVTLTRIQAHDVDSSDYAFYQGAQRAMQEALRIHGVPAGSFTIREAFEQPLRWIKLTPGSEKYAVITLRLEPLPTETVEFNVALPDKIRPDHVEPGYFAAVEEGIRGCAKEREIAGVRATLISIEAHPIDSSRVSFAIAGYQAMRQAIETHGVPVSGYTLPMANIYLKVIGLGFIAGARSMMAPALTSSYFLTHPSLFLEASPLKGIASPKAANVLRLMALGELVGDKLPMTPNRTALLPLGGRAASGGLCGAAIFAAEDQPAAIGAAVGAAAAIASTFLTYTLRRSLVKATKLPDPVVAVTEDALMLGLGRAVFAGE